MSLKDLSYTNAGVKTISSREVAEMMDVKKHSDMLAKIEKIDEVLADGKIRSLEYWQESTYLDAQGKPRKEYQVTKKGCELLAHKSTGEKGIIFTVKYMERFQQMEQELKQQTSISHSPMDILKLTFQALEGQDEKLTKLEEKFSEFEENAPLSPSEYGMVSQKVTNRVYAIKQELGHQLTRKQQRELYKAINREIKVITGVSHRCQLRQRHLGLVLDFIRTWEPSRATLVVINQMSLEV